MVKDILWAFFGIGALSIGENILMEVVKPTAPETVLAPHPLPDNLPSTAS
jgi:hypothetical protein